MSASESTWESAIEASAQPAAVESEPQAVEEVAPEAEVPVESAETETQTTDDVAPSDTPAREVEAAVEEVPKEEAKPEAEDIQPDDPEEVKALPTASARRWARTRDREAKLVDDYLDPTKPVSAVAERLEQKSQSRYHELVDDFFENHGEQYLQKRYGLKAEELDAIVKGAEGRPPSEPADPDYDPLADPLIADEFKQELRELRGMKDEFGQVKSKVEGFETKEQERERLAQEAESNAIKNEVFQSVFPVVVEAVKEYGLEPSKDDPPRIAALKKIGARLLVEDVDPVFMKDAENKKAVDRVNHWASKREKENALREADALKVRSRAAAETVRQGEEVDTILWVIEELTKSKAEKIQQRGKGQPPVPAGAPPGGAAIPKTEITSWEQALASVGK